MTQLKRLEERVHTYLAEMGLEAKQSGDDLYIFRYGTTVVMVRLFEDEDDSFVRFASIMLKDVDPSHEFLRRILQLNAQVLFGAFLLFEDNTLSFSSTLLGNHLDYDEFETALTYVAKVSDEYDDELQRLAGGQRAEDVFRED